MATDINDARGCLNATGLTDAERYEVEALLDTWSSVSARNAMLDRYYEGKMMPKDIGVEMFDPQQMRGLDVLLSCDWPRKAVHALKGHVRFDGFVFRDNAHDAGLDAMLSRYNFMSAFSRNLTGVLKNGVAFATVNAGPMGAEVRFHTANSAVALFDHTTEQVRSGLVIAEKARTRWSPKREVVTRVNLIMAGSRKALIRYDATRWYAKAVKTSMRRPMMVAFAYAPTDTKPLGSTRITRQVMDLVDDVLRVRLAMVLSVARYTTPMRALLGLSDEMFDALTQTTKWAAYINPIIFATSDEDGNTPTLTQLPAVSPEPLIRLIEEDAKLFAGATGVPLNSLGIVQDNPSSAEAIQEGRKDLQYEAEALIDEQLTPALRDLALMVMAVESNVSDVSDLTDVQKSVMPHFRNPTRPSIAASTDAAMKIASACEGFAETDEFFRMVGFDQATIERVQSDIRRSQARNGALAALGRATVLTSQAQSATQQSAAQQSTSSLTSSPTTPSTTPPMARDEDTDDTEA